LRQGNCVLQKVFGPSSPIVASTHGSMSIMRVERKRRSVAENWALDPKRIDRRKR
jgi:hypothetical protein